MATITITATPVWQCSIAACVVIQNGCFSNLADGRLHYSYLMGSTSNTLK
uniref:Uncharacterized protein n=1 Tax=Arundo donax TaxID=35708 RepID=A0A0A8ZAR1_ARUDO